MGKRSVAWMAAVVLSGCASTVVQTERLPEGREASPSINGVVYFLPRDFASIEVKREKCKLDVKVSTVRLPDTKRALVLKYDKNPIFRHNTIQVQTSNGLVTSINATSENQSSSIVSEVLGLARSLSTAGLPVNNTDLSCKPDAMPDFVKEVLVDPYDSASWSKSVNEFQEFGVKLTVKGDVNNENAVATSSEAITANDCGVGAAATSGICYRLTKVMPFTVEARQIGQTVSREFKISVVDTQRSFRVPFDANAFAKFDVKLTFDRGVLTKFDSDDPASALAALQIPTELVKGVLGLSSTSSVAPSKGK